MATGVPGVDGAAIGARLRARRSGRRRACGRRWRWRRVVRSKAQGGIQASFGADDSPEQHAADVWSPRTRPRTGLVEVLTGDAPSAIHWLEELGVEFTRDEDGGYRLARCGGATPSASCRSATAPATRSRSSCVTPGRPERERYTNSPLRGLREALTAAGTRASASTSSRLGAWAVAELVRRASGGASTNHPNATGEVTQLALGLGAEARDLDALQYYLNGRLAAEHAGVTSYPEINRAYGAERGRRGVHRLTRPARRGALALRDFVEDRLADLVARAE